MNNYIIDILKEVNTIIIPDFGALTIVDKAKNEIMFMSYLKYDDGELAKYMAKRESMELNDAKNMIAKYVREIKSILDKGETYDLYQFGSFSKSQDGEIVFTVWDGLSESSSELETTDSEQESTTQIVSPIDEVEEQEINEEPQIEESKEEAEPMKEEVKVEDPMPIQKEVNDENVQPLTVEEQLKDDLDVPPINQKKTPKKKPILEKTEADKKRRSPVFYILIAFVVLLAAGGTYVGLNYQQIKEQYFTWEPEVKSEPVVETQGAPEESSTIEESNTEDELAQENSADQAGQEELTKAEEKNESPVQNNYVSSSLSIDKTKRVQAIVGSFGEESNATGLVSKLQGEGHAAGIVGVYSGLHFVSIGSFNDVSELNASKSVLDGVGATYWIFTKKH